MPISLYGHMKCLVSRHNFDYRTTMDEECNNDVDDTLFYFLGLDLVWHDNNGHWIPDEYRYPPGHPQPLNWYEYCVSYNITWTISGTLPNWAIELMDQYYRDLYYNTQSEENN